MKRNQPDIDELKRKEQEAIEEAEKLSANPPEEPQEETPEEEKSEEPEPKKEPEKEEQAYPSEEIKEQLKVEVKEKEKKLSASARENQKIYAKNRVINQALIEAEDVPEPTQEELLKEFPDYELMSDTEKVFARETLVNKKWRQVISNAKQQATKIEKWNESVDTFIEDPKTLIAHPDLEGKTEAFRQYALVEANNSVPFNILISAFLNDYASNKPLNKGKMFEKGSGGGNEKPQPKSDKLTLEESRKLRDSDYNKWREMLKAGKIEISV